jgi:hypothetical protein
MDWLKTYKSEELRLKSERQNGAHWGDHHVAGSPWGGESETHQVVGRLEHRDNGSR